MKIDKFFIIPSLFFLVAIYSLIQGAPLLSLIAFPIGLAFLIVALNPPKDSPLEETYPMKEVVAESWWGALAAYPILLAFGYILYQGYTIGQPGLSIIFGFILLGFLEFQIETISKTKKFLASFSAGKFPTPSLKDLLKILIGIIGLIVFWEFVNGNYPFPKGDSGLGIFVYYVVSWLIGWFFSNLDRWKHIRVESKTATGTTRTLSIIMMIPIFLATMSVWNNPAAFYTFSIIPLGVFFILLISWLLEK